MPPPLTLESHNRIVHDTIIEKLQETDKPSVFDITIADFNQVQWHMFTSDDGLTMSISVSTRCWAQIGKYSTPLLKTIYGATLVAPEPKFDVTVNVVVSPETKAKAEEVAMRVASLARNMMAGPFVHFFDKATARGPAETLQIDYRPAESMWLRLEGDRIICIFSIFFDDADDIVIGKVFLQEMGKTVQGAPSIDVYLKDPPRELARVPNLRAHGYVSFLLESRHITPKQRDVTINMLTQYRNFTHYHIKCSKAYLHIRMRNRVNSLLQVLNRAKQEKTAAEKAKAVPMFARR